ncbi:hypothetical protein ACFLYR_06905 [Chloroflexota bacterium]
MDSTVYTFPGIKTPHLSDDRDTGIKLIFCHYSGYLFRAKIAVLLGKGVNGRRNDKLGQRPAGDDVMRR